MAASLCHEEPLFLNNAHGFWLQPALYFSHCVSLRERRNLCISCGATSPRHTVVSFWSNTAASPWPLSKLKDQNCS
jgi:hypothetical protein